MKAAQAILLGFVFLLAGLAWAMDLPLGGLLSDLLVRLPMNGILVLSMLPMYNAGLGINFGLPVAVIGGLLGMCLAVNMRVSGLPGLLAAMALGLPWTMALGWAYGRLLRRVRGREEIAATFIGFSFVSLMNLFWVLAPFSNPAMLWPIGGQGLRPIIGLGPYFAKSLNRLWAVDAWGVTVPAGMLLGYGLVCLGLHLFFRTRTGLAMTSAGENEAFARVSGVAVERIRSAAVILSTCLGGMGIVFYAQSYGFLELYDAPLMMGFPAASAVLIGGLGRKRIDVGQAMLGTVLFQAMLVLSAPIANVVLAPEAAEIVRMLLTNAIILFALLARVRARS